MNVDDIEDDTPEDDAFHTGWFARSNNQPMIAPTTLSKNQQSAWLCGYHFCAIDLLEFNK